MIIVIVQFQPDSYNWAHEGVVSHALLSKWCAGELANARLRIFLSYGQWGGLTSSLIRVLFLGAPKI